MSIPTNYFISTVIIQTTVRMGEEIDKYEQKSRKAENNKK